MRLTPRRPAAARLSRALALGAAAVTLAVAPGARAQAPRGFGGAPRARWIAPPGVPPDSFVVFHARRTLDLPERPAHFVVHVSADNRYRLYVNGVDVATGPQRSDVAHWRYETVDLAPRLRAGRNVIAAVVWSLGYARPVAQFSHRAGFVLQGDGPIEAALVNTGPGWRLLRDSAYAPLVVTSAMLRGYYAAVPGEAVDGARYPWGWESPGYDDARWAVVGPASAPAGGIAAPLAAFDVPPGSAVVGTLALRGDAGAGGEVIGWQLAPRELPPMDEVPERFAAVRRTTGLPPEARADAPLRGAGDLVIPPRARVTVLLDEGRTTNAYPVVTVSGGAGSVMGLTYAEALVDARGQKGHRDSVSGRAVRGVRDEFRPDGGARRTFRPLWWRSYRYAELEVRTGDAALVVHDVHGVFTGYPLRERARFAGDLPWLADVWRMNWNGVRLGAFETYMDTPYWEQLQYVGDTRVQALLSLYLSGDDRLVRQAVEAFDASRAPDGLTTSRYPSVIPQRIPPFSLIYVLMVDDYLRHRDDPAFVRARLAGVRGVLDWYADRVDTTGLLGPTPHWNYLDWARGWNAGVPPGAEDGHSVPLTLLYAHALRRAAAVEDDVGIPGVAVAYRARADALAAAARRRAWNPARGLFRDVPGGERGDTSYSQHANALAVLAGAVPAAERRAVMGRVLDDTTLVQATYYFGFYVFEAMREAGLGDRYVERLGPWRAMLARGLTSTPETPDPTRSDTHAWAAHPNYGLLATVLGVRPASAGFRTVRIAPALGPLRHAEGVVPHPRGEIVARLDRAGARGLHAEVTLPPGVAGTLEWDGRRVPLRAGRQVVTM